MLSSLVLLYAAGAFTPVVTQSQVSPQGVPSLQIGELSPPLTGELSSAVVTWALSQRVPLGLPAGSTLRFSHALATKFGASFHLLQVVGDVEVYDAKVVVTLDENARVVQVASSLVPFAFLRDGFAMSQDQALVKATAAIVLPALRDDGSGLPYGGAKKMFFPSGVELHAGYLAHVASLDVSKNWYVAVDAVTGERLFVEDRVHHALDANVYPVSPGGLDAGVGKTPTARATLTHNDGGTMVASTCEALQRDGGWAVTANTKGQLCGDLMTQFNCCTREGCKADAGTKHERSTTSFMGVQVEFDIAVCDRLRRASPQANDAGANYLYTPVDPPADKSTINLDDPAHFDEFAEVHSFYHVNRVYDWVRGLSASAQPIFAGQPSVQVFAMRDERRSPPRKPAIWANVLFPDINDAFNSLDFSCLINPPCRAKTDKLMRIDNAAFMPVENLGQLPFPGFDTGVDTLLIFQGNSADAAYDSSVIQHEFGHGVVYATAGLGVGNVTFDARSANNEGGALHEGFADYISAAFNDEPHIGLYFGPRAIAGTAAVTGLPQDDYLRALDNTFTCPSVLWGEVHQDSQHLSAALWSGRNAFRGIDNGATYDAAFYAMLSSITPTADFAQVAAAMSARVKQAFPGNATAQAQMTQIFAAKGVTGCSKVLDVAAGDAPRMYYGIAAASGLGNSVVPGPFQFRLRTPNGATKIRVTGQVRQSRFGGLGGGSATTVLLAKEGAPITFTKTATSLTNDSAHSGPVTTAQQTVSGSVDVAAPCGTNSDVYVTIASTGPQAIFNVAVTAEAPSSCPVVADAGSGGPRGSDGGTTVTLPAVGASSTASASAAKTCGCTSSELMPMAGLALAALALRRRRYAR